MTSRAVVGEPAQLAVERVGDVGPQRRVVAVPLVLAPRRHRRRARVDIDLERLVGGDLARRRGRGRSIGRTQRTRSWTTGRKYCSMPGTAPGRPVAAEPVQPQRHQQHLDLVVRGLALEVLVAVGDDVQAREVLVLDGEAHGVLVQRALVHVREVDLVRRLAQHPAAQPQRPRPAADHRRRQQDRRRSARSSSVEQRVASAAPGPRRRRTGARRCRAAGRACPSAAPAAASPARRPRRTGCCPGSPTARAAG